MNNFLNILCNFFQRTYRYYTLILDLATQVQILDDAVCISVPANTVRKGMNPLIFPLAMGK